MARPSGMQGRRVKWIEMVDSFDSRTIVGRLTPGIVVETHWDGGVCHCLVADKDGRLSMKKASDLTLFDGSPVTDRVSSSLTK